MSASVCKGCGVSVPESKNPGVPRMWCSDRCRKLTLYGADCVQCGKRHYTGKQGVHAAPLCRECGSRAAAKTSALRSRARNAWRRDLIERRWNEGATLLEIAAELDSTKASIGVTINRMRHEGRDVPYRNNGYDRFPNQVAA